jgi:Fe-S cluster biogenesis protein NfuA
VDTPAPPSGSPADVDPRTAYSRRSADDPELLARIDAALDRVRPGIHADGGDVWLMHVADGVAYVQMIGACGGCAAALTTLKLGIERAVCEDVPEIRAVEQL